MEKKYFLAKRFNKIARFTYAVTVILCLQGAVIYSYLFPNVSAHAVIILYSVWGAACLAIEKFIFSRSRKKICYIVSDKAFIVHGFGNTVREYAYENITGVVEEKFTYDNFCRVKFLFGELNLELKINRCLDDPCGVALEIIKRLPKRVKVDENLVKQLEAFSLQD